MKSLFLRMLSACIFLSALSASACPTCIGNIDKNTPPFFSDDYEAYSEMYEDGGSNDTSSKE